MPIFLPDDNMRTDPNQEKFNAMWWRICSVTGAGKTFLQSWIPRLGPDWQPIPNTHTTPETELGALPQNFQNLRDQITGLSTQVAVLKATVEQLAKVQGFEGQITIDDATVKAIAKSVVDEEARRLSGTPVLAGNPPVDTP